MRGTCNSQRFASMEMLVLQFVDAPQVVARSKMARAVAIARVTLITTYTDSRCSQSRSIYKPDLALIFNYDGRRFGRSVSLVVAVNAKSHPIAQTVSSHPIFALDPNQ